MGFRTFAAAIAAGWLVLAGAPPVSAQVSEPSAAIPTDPAVREGRLANGLRYALMRNDRPEGGVSIRMRFDVGSYEEPEAHRGVAHFLEHMAFNGTRTLAEGELSRRFAEAGVTFGRDQNASTSHFTTTYQLDLPRSGDAALDLAFGWLRDIGDGLLLTPEAVTREQGVVLAEHDTRLGPAKTWQDAYQAFAAPDARSRARPPIGTPDTIRAIDTAALSAFHSAWYRPDNAFITVVGDLPLNVLEARVRQTFDSWIVTGEAPARAEATPLDIERPLDVLVRPDAVVPASISLCRLSPWPSYGPDTVARRRTFITRGLWSSVLNRRLQLLSQGSDAPFTAARVVVSPWVREADALCLSVSPPVSGDWNRALTVALAEIRQFESQDPEPAEIARFVDAQKRQNSTSVSQANDRFSRDLAQSLLALFPQHDRDPGSFVHPREIPSLYNTIVADITPTDIREDFVRAWNTSEPLIAIVMPDPPPADEVRSLWASHAAALAPELRAAAPDVGSWAYGDFGPPGRIVSRERIRRPAFTRVRFANGVILNVKSVAHTRSQVQLAVDFGAGRASVTDDDYQTASIGVNFLFPGGLGQHSLTEVQDLFPERRLGLSFRMLDDTVQAWSTTTPADLERQLELTAAMFSDPGFRDDLAGQRQQMIDTVYRAWRSLPAVVAEIAISEALAPGNPRLIPPRERMDALTMADFDRLFRPLLTEGPLEVTLVGDMPERRMIDLVARTLGALPNRRALAPAAAPPFVVRYGDARPQVSAVHEGSRDQAAYTAHWPLYVSDPARRREQRALQILRLVLQERVRAEVREALGASYSPGVSLTFEDDGDQGRMVIGVITAPADIARVGEAVRRVVGEIASGAVTLEELDNARGPALARAPDERATNSWWYSTLTGSAREPHRLRDPLEWEADYRAITLDELKTAARIWLSGPPIEGVALPTAEPSPLAGGAD
ncbi:MAG: insulinase family protein [Brevundimonas sp.]|uniref:M16 family metallopeptidase n=1 Tax=Brevundimonas sp. TaxID=1871086 RepID=UPI002735B4A7|nr:M16 family metallopeptidase [Brevundimonas sp.]MDP3404481.1 insulinase family protein [Brevundimonas sp.]